MTGEKPVHVVAGPEEDGEYGTQVILSVNFLDATNALLHLYAGSGRREV